MAKLMDLYQWTGSPPCQAVMMTAKMLKVNFNLIEVDLMEYEHKKPEFMKINPHHTVPTIVDNGFTLWESRPIMTYLVEKYARKDTLYPKNPAQRAKVNQRLYFDYEMYGKFGAFYFPPVFGGKPGNQEKYDEAVKSMEVLEQTLASQAYAAGEHLTLADISLATTVSVAEAFGYDLSAHPNISAWFAKCKGEIAGYEEINQQGLNKMKAVISEKSGPGPTAY
jgi:glutathione S-transferase